MAKTKSTTKKRRVTFSFMADHANEIDLMGDFNGWKPRAHPMKNNGNGIWTKAVLLSPGSYEYKFLVDGQWRIDPQNKNMRTNCFGTQNNIFSVQAK